MASHLAAQPHIDSRRRILELDGLRGLAVLMVVGCHYLVLDAATRPSATRGQLFGFRILQSGLDLFFVLSGFLIARILLAQRDSPNYFATFYGRRVYRIAPVYYAFLAVVLIQGVLWHARGKSSVVYDAEFPFWLYPLFLQNFALALFPNASGWLVVGITWSLALEEQFYLTVPALVRAASTNAVAVCCALVLVAAPLARHFIALPAGPLGALALAALRVDALSAGVLLAIGLRRGAVLPIRLVAATMAAAAIGVVLTETRLIFLRETMLIGLYASALWLAVHGALPLLRAGWLRFFGTISYALYLVHQLVLVSLHSLLRHSAPSFSSGPSRLVTGVAFGLAVTMCTISWHYVERPLVERGHRLFPY